MEPASDRAGSGAPDLRVDLGLAGLVLAIVYSLAALPLAGPGALPPLLLPFVVTVIASAWTLAGRGTPLGLLEAGWPIAAWPFLYMGCVRIVERVPWSADALLARADRLLVGPLSWPLGGPVEELASAVYASYYVAIPAGFLWLWVSGRRRAAAAYTTALLVALVACALGWLLVPAGGPHPNGAPDGTPFGPFTAFMRYVYDCNPHHSAAFPSSHVALATAATAVAVRSGLPRVALLWPLAIGWATVAGQYHYAVDTPPALIVGILAASLATRSRVPASLADRVPAAP